MPSTPRPAGLPEKIPAKWWLWLLLPGQYHTKKPAAFWVWRNWRLGKTTDTVKLPHLLQSPSPNYSERKTTISLVVIHDTEGAYSAAVNWLKNPKANASAHVVLREDGKEATQLVRYSKKAWSCMAFNSPSLNLEMAGKASVGYGAAEIDAAARIAAYWCTLYKIPVRHAVGGNGSGITFHQELGAAGGGHHDPGWDLSQRKAFIDKVQSYMGHGFAPVPWGKV